MKTIKFFFTSVLFLIFFTASISSISAVEHSHSWSKRLGAASGDYINWYGVLDFDSSGNVAVMARISTDADLNNDGDTSDDGESAAGYGSYDNVVVVFNSAGEYVWSKRLGGAANDTNYNLRFDSNDNLIIVGGVTGDADLNGDGDFLDGNGEDSTGYANADVAISVFDSSGTYVWSKRLGGASGDLPRDIAIDGNNNVYIVTEGQGTFDLNGDGDGLDDGESAVGYGNYDVLISAFNSSGVFIWGKRLGSTSQDSIDYASADIVNNYILVTG